MKIVYTPTDFVITYDDLWKWKWTPGLILSYRDPREGRTDEVHFDEDGSWTLRVVFDGDLKRSPRLYSGFTSLHAVLDYYRSDHFSREALRLEEN